MSTNNDEQIFSELQQYFHNDARITIVKMRGITDTFDLKTKALVTKPDHEKALKTPLEEYYKQFVPLEINSLLLTTPSAPLAQVTALIEADLLDLNNKYYVFGFYKTDGFLIKLARSIYEPLV